MDISQKPNETNLEHDSIKTNEECKLMQAENNIHAEADEAVNLDDTTAQVLHSIVAEVSKKSTLCDNKERLSKPIKELVHKSVQYEDEVEHLSNNSSIKLDKSIQAEDIREEQSNSIFHSFANETVDSAATTIVVESSSISTQTDIEEKIQERHQKELKEKDLLIFQKEETIEKLQETLKLKGDAEKEIIENKLIISEKEEIIAKLQSMLKSKDNAEKEIIEKNLIITEKEEIIAKLQSMLKSKDSAEKEIIEKNLIITEKEEIIAKLESTLKLKDNEIEKISASLLTFTQQSSASSIEKPSETSRPKLKPGRHRRNMKTEIETDNEELDSTKQLVGNDEKPKISETVKINSVAEKKQLGRRGRPKRKESTPVTEVEKQSTDNIVNKPTVTDGANKRTLRGRKRENSEQEENPIPKRFKGFVKEKRRSDSTSPVVKVDDKKESRSYSLRNRK